MISFTQKFYFAIKFEEKRKLFQAKQALVVKAMYQSAFLAREKVLNFDRWLSDFENFLKYLLSTKSQTNHLKL